MSDVTVESLQIEIAASATSADAALEKLRGTLERLKTATKGGAGLNTVSKQLSKLDSVLASMGSHTSALRGLIDPLNSLAGVNAAGITALNRPLKNLSATIASLSGSNLGAIRDVGDAVNGLSGLTLPKGLNTLLAELRKFPKALAELSGADFSVVDRVGTAMRGLASIPKSGLSTILSELRKLPKTLEGLDTATLDAFEQAIRRITAALQPLVDQMNEVSTAFSSLPANVRRVVSATGSIPTANNAAASSYGKLKESMKSIFQTGKRVASVIAGWINESITHIETMNLFAVSMGQYGQQAIDYANRVADAVGIDPAEWMKDQSVFMSLAQGFGVASDRAYTMSKNLTQLVYDLSALHNISTEVAMQKLQSGIAGEIEPMRALGYDLSMARLEEVAKDLGISKKVSDMTQAEKVQLRYVAALQQTTAAQGEWAKTINNPANQLRVLKAQITQITRALGNIFIPILNRILPYAIAIAKVIKDIINLIGSLFGFKLPDVDYSAGLNNAAGGADDLTDSLDNAGSSAKKLKSYMLGFDELNVIDPTQGTGSGGSGSGSGGSWSNFDLPEYDFLENLTQGNSLYDRMKEWLGIPEEFTHWTQLFDLETNLGKILTTVTLIGAGFAAWKIAKGIADVGKTVGAIADGLKTLKNGTGIVSAFFNNFKTGSLAIGGAALAVGGLIGYVSGLSDICQNGANAANVLKTALGALAMAAGGFLVALALGASAGIAGIVAAVVAAIAAVVALIAANWDKVKAFFAGIPAWFGNLCDQIGSFFSNLWSGIVTGWQNVKTGAQNAWNGFTGWISTNVTTPIANLFTNAWTGVKNTWGNVVGWFRNIGQNIRNVFSSLNIHIKVPHFSWSTVPASGWVGKVLSTLGLPASLPKLNISWYANGGFPATGELFVAREAGPEMVGSIGGKSAVANNDQIVQAISVGVYEAVVSAMQATGGDDGETVSMVVNLDGEKIYENQQKIAKKRGYNMGMGAFSFG